MLERTTAELAHPKHGSFEAYLRKHNIEYPVGSDEYKERFAIFLQRHAWVNKMNRRPNKTWTASLNSFGTHRDHELKVFLGYKKRRTATAMSLRARRLVDYDIYESESQYWTETLDSLSLIRDQGRCGSCWAVTSTTVLDAHAEIAGWNRTFSTQHVVDCVPNPDSCGGSGGCDGATVELAFQYAMLKGIDTPSKYGAYVAYERACPWDANGKSSPTMNELTNFASGQLTTQAPADAQGRTYGMIGWSRLPSNSYKELIEAVTKDGPVAVALTASNLFYYSSGIFNDCDWIVNHAVTLVGYGKDEGQKFWLVQNSWGNGWGEAGRIRVARNDAQSENSNCGMDDHPEQGIACEGEADPVQVCGTCGILFDSVVPHFKKVGEI